MKFHKVEFSCDIASRVSSSVLTSTSALLPDSLAGPLDSRWPFGVCVTYGLQHTSQFHYLKLLPKPRKKPQTRRQCRCSLYIRPFQDPLCRREAILCVDACAFPYDVTTPCPLGKSVTSTASTNMAWLINPNDEHPEHSKIKI